MNRDFRQTAKKTRKFRGLAVHMAPLSVSLSRPRALWGEFPHRVSPSKGGVSRRVSKLTQETG